MKQYVRFIDKKTRSFTMTKSYTTDDEFFEIMDNIDPRLWEVSFDEIKR